MITTTGTPLSPRGECIACDAYRGIIRREIKGPLCDACKGLNARYREAEQLVAGWAGKQAEVAARGGWTPEELREHHKALHPEGRT